MPSRLTAATGSQVVSQKRATNWWTSPRAAVGVGQRHALFVVQLVPGVVVVGQRAEAALQVLQPHLGGDEVGALVQVAEQGSAILVGDRPGEHHTVVLLVLGGVPVQVAESGVHGRTVRFW
jgi:hypothetical protein